MSTLVVICNNILWFSLHNSYTRNKVLCFALIRAGEISCKNQRFRFLPRGSRRVCLRIGFPCPPKITLPNSAPAKLMDTRLRIESDEKLLRSIKNPQRSSGSTRDAAQRTPQSKGLRISPPAALFPAAQAAKKIRAELMNPIVRSVAENRPRKKLKSGSRAAAVTSQASHASFRTPGRSFPKLSSSDIKEYPRL